MLVRYVEVRHWICFRQLYVLYNNYIYNVYKDGIL